MLKRGEVDLAYLLDAPQAAGGQARSQRSSSPSPAGSAPSTSTSSTSGIRSRRGRPARAAGRQPTRSIARRSARRRRSAPRGRPAASSRGRSSSRCRSSPIPTIRRRPSSCWPRPAIRTASTPATAIRGRPYFSMGEAIVGLPRRGRASRCRMRTMERAAFYVGAGGEEAQGALHLRQRGLRQRRLAACPRSCRATAPSPTAAIPTSTRSTSSRRARPTARSARRMLHQIQQLAPRARALRARSTTTSGRAAWARGWRSPALMLIDPYPWSAPLEDVRLKK